MPGGARRAARNRTPTLRHRESSEQLEDEVGDRVCHKHDFDKKDIGSGFDFPTLDMHLLAS